MLFWLIPLTLYGMKWNSQSLGPQKELVAVVEVGAVNEAAGEVAVAALPEVSAESK